MNTVTAALVLLALDGACATPVICTFYTLDACRCHTDTGTILDISKYFKYPVVVEDSGYKYTYNPCVPFECGSGEPAVLCQEAIGTGEQHALGRLDGSTWWYVYSYYPLQFALHYNGGDPIPIYGNREAQVGMLHDNSAMSAVYIDNFPDFMYNFGITGNKVVPQHEICTIDPTNSCRCQTNTMSLDISEYFDYPVVMRGQEEYSYIYSPCKPVPCGNELVAVCQVWIARDVYHPVGILNNSTSWQVNSFNPLQFTIHYFGGEEKRNAVFNMSYDETDMSVQFISESPTQTSYFAITGNEVLAKPNQETCTFHHNDSCRCHTDTISLDMRDYFEYPVEVKGDNTDSYIYSPCKPIRCGNETAEVCQVSRSPEKHYVAGRLDNSTLWYVSSHDPLHFTIHYFGGEKGRNAGFSVSYEDRAMHLYFTSEYPLLTYNFGIYGKKVVPAAPANAIPHASEGS